MSRVEKSKHFFGDLLPEDRFTEEAYAKYVDTHPRRDRSDQLWQAYRFEKDKKIKRRMDNR